jgi:hypothetical protein
MSYILVASGKGETAKGEAKFFEFTANNLKSSDYPHLPSKKIGDGENAKNVPVIKVSPTAILVREYSSIADARAHAESKGVSPTQFETAVLDLINTAERNETVRIVRSRVIDSKILPADLADFVRDAADEVNIFVETEKSSGRVSLKATQEKAAQIAEQYKDNPAQLATELMALLGLNK